MSDLRLTQVAYLLGVSRSTVMKASKNLLGFPAAVYHEGNCRRFWKRSDIVEWKKNNGEFCSKHHFREPRGRHPPTVRMSRAKKGDPIPNEAGILHTLWVISRLVLLSEKDRIALIQLLLESAGADK